MYLGKFGQNGSEDNAQKLFWTFQSAGVTLKIRSRSPKSNLLFPSSQQCVYASLVEIHPLAQKISHGKEADEIRTKINIYPHPSGWGDINIHTVTAFYIPFSVYSLITSLEPFILALVGYLV